MDGREAVVHTIPRLWLDDLGYDRQVVLGVFSLSRLLQGCQEARWPDGGDNTGRFPGRAIAIAASFGRLKRL
jgi:hypothetical protein